MSAVGCETARRDVRLAEGRATPELAGPERPADARSRRVWTDEQARLAADAAARKLSI